MDDMRYALPSLVLASLVAVLLLTAAAPASADLIRIAPARDISFPFECTWAWDWGPAPDHRCGWDDSESLRVGGDVHNVWRAALEFSLEAVPADALVNGAFLGAWFDGGCVAARLTRGPCPLASYPVEAWSIVGAPWFEEREVERGTLFASERLDAWSGPRWLYLDVTELVRAWLDGLPNRGVLLKLPDGVEDNAGPLFGSANGLEPSLRPWLEIDFDEP